jgi:3-hydroxy-3-methylglutaryl CoA synthase
MTDLARRHFGDPAELTAGSGAVAVTIGAEPRVLAIEPRSGYACREVYDVARPTATGEYGDAVLSIAAYLDLIEEAWANYRHATRMDVAVDERFRYVLYHTPLVSLARDAHRLLLETHHDDISVTEARQSFDHMVKPALGYARELANIYSGSVYCLLAGLLDGDAELASLTPIGICSYGSGSCTATPCCRPSCPSRPTRSGRPTAVRASSCRCRTSRPSRTSTPVTVPASTSTR